ncbi:acyltransferase family protein [Pseudarthrobacter enclensis]|uniref:acyltransferase family protein n=1 Tax=Pseudarthrobacter enclensis TaxID=993070 RepID=UPI003EE350DA
MKHRSASTLLSTSKFEGVQALRFVAAALVVVTHSTLYTHERLNPEVSIWGFGTIGVNIFFAISGFVMVVSTDHIRRDREAWKYFSMRRIARIVPMYWLATTSKLLTMIVLPGAALHATLDPGATILSYFFLPSRNVDGDVQPLLGVGWTLVFEMFFYAIFALALYLKVNPVIFSGCILLICATGSAFRGDEEWPVWAFYFDPIVLYFLIGMLIATFQHNLTAVKCTPYLLALLSGCQLIFVAWPAPEGSSENFVFLMLITIILVLGTVWLEPLIQGRIPKLLLFLGAASYSLYLFHPMIAPIVPEILNRVGIYDGTLSVVLCLLLALIITSVIYKVVEVPITKKLQNVLPYVRRPQQETTLDPRP